ncbi:MAG: zinc ribbon domain-containing protein [Proteobacteria bacterium]|nr:zinc ribbon domain-containing protein [Pseudomonadota bacterium]
MPIYEFECKKCKFNFESYVLTAEERIKCPRCDSEEVTKLISAPNFGSSSSSNSCGGSHSSGFS